MFSYFIIVLAVSIFGLAKPFPQISDRVIIPGKYTVGTISNADPLTSPVEVEDVGGSDSSLSQLSQNPRMRSNPSSPGTQCSPDASVDISDEKTIFERQTKSCPTGLDVKTPSTVDELLNLNGRHPSGATRKKPVMTNSDNPCAKYEGVNKHVTCGGPKIGPTEHFVAIVLNCVPGQFFDPSLTFIAFEY